MDDGSSTYSDAYADDDYVYGTGNTLGALEIHSYGVHVTIESPLGRTASQYGSFGFGDVSTSVALTWNVDDFGVYGIRSEHELYCWYVHDTFWLATTTAASLPPAPPCNEKYWTCSEYNREGPVGTKKSSSCKRSPYCCGPEGGEPITDWCRTETCNKCPSQQLDPKWSWCFASRSNCEYSGAAWCMGQQCQ